MVLLLLIAPVQMVNASDSNMSCADFGNVTLQGNALPDTDNPLNLKSSDNNFSFTATAVHQDQPSVQNLQCTSCVPCSAAMSMDSINMMLSGINLRSASNKSSYNSYISPSIRPPIVISS